jgi:sulfotransferase
MLAFHSIAGVPRSGSTLLCNILNQNPDFYASDTSVVPELLGVMTQKFSNSPEVQGMLAADKDGTEFLLNEMLSIIIETWYHMHDGVVFDKSRGWPFHNALLTGLYPNAKLIVTTRDLRNVFASMEKQHRATPMFDLANSPVEKTAYDRADKFMSKDGVIGSSVIALQDLVDRCADNVFVVAYERLCTTPGIVIEDLYKFLKLEPFEHTFKAVENVSDEPDYLYLNKFPHEGSGDVAPTDIREWQKFISNDLGEMIYNVYPKYNKLFGY